MTEKYNIEGMTCNGCRTRVENALKEIDKNATVDLSSQSAEVDASVNREKVIEIVNKVGYKVI